MVKPVDGNAGHGQLAISGHRRLLSVPPRLSPLTNIVNTQTAEPSPLLSGRASLTLPPPALLASSLQSVSNLFRDHLPPPPRHTTTGAIPSYTGLSREIDCLQLSDAAFPVYSGIALRHCTRRDYAGKEKTLHNKARRGYMESAEAIQRRAIEAHSNPPRRHRTSALPQHRPFAEQDRQAVEAQPPAEQPRLASEQNKFLHQVMQNMPHIAQQILHETRSLHLQALRNRVGKETYVAEDRTAIKQALQHFMVTDNPQRLRRLIKHKISENPRLCTADKQVLLTHIRDNVCALRPVCTLIRGHRTGSFPVKLEDLPTGLTSDFIFLLEKWGVTIAELSAYLHATTTAAAIKYHEIWGLIDDEINIALKKENLPGQLLAAMRDLAASFSDRLDNIAPYLEPEMDYGDSLILHHIREERGDDYRAENLDFYQPLRLFYGLEAEKIFTREIKKNRELYILQDRYLNSAPLLELFKQVTQHDASLMERSVLNPEQYQLFLASDIRALKALLTSGVRERARIMLENTTVLPFIFGDPQHELVINSEEQRYGGRGLPVSLIFSWLTDDTLSPAQFEVITRYLNYRLSEITTTGSININWIRGLSAQTLERFLLQLTGFTASGYDDYPDMVLYHATIGIGKAILSPDFNFQQLPELLAWIRANASFTASTAPKPSDDELACLMFQFIPDTENTLTWIADKLRTAADEGQSREILAGSARQGFRRFIAQYINDDALSQLRAPGEYRDCLTLRDQLNREVLPDTLLRFVAQRFHIAIIEENSEQDFLRLFDITGDIVDQPPVSPEDAIIVRPGILIPLDMAGIQQATILPERADNHSLLRELVRYLHQKEGLLLSDGDLDVQVATLSREILASRKSNS